MVVKQFQDGGRPPFWKSLYRHISAKNHPISMKFCTQQQILNWMNATWSKMKKLHWTDSEFDRTYFLYKLYDHKSIRMTSGVNKIYKFNALRQRWVWYVLKTRTFPQQWYLYEWYSIISTERLCMTSSVTHRSSLESYPGWLTSVALRLLAVTLHCV